MYLHCWTEILAQDFKKQSAKFYFFRLATFFSIYHKFINTTPRDVTHVDDDRIDITQQNGRRQKGPFFCSCWVKFLEAEKLKGRDSTYWFVSTLKLRDTQFRNSQEWTLLVLTTRNGFVCTKSLNMKTAVASYPSTHTDSRQKANESAARCLEQVVLINP